MDQSIRLYFIFIQMKNTYAANGMGSQFVNVRPCAQYS